jgi:beta-glucosidase
MKFRVAKDGLATKDRFPLKSSSSVRMMVLCGVLGTLPLFTALEVGAGGEPGEGAANSHPFPHQPELGWVTKSVIRVGNKLFKDLNGNGKLDKYEDWRLPVDKRVDDLVSQMTLEEKAGLMLIDAERPVRGALKMPDTDNYINTQKMHRFIFRNTVTGVGTTVCRPTRASVPAPPSRRRKRRPT